MFLCLPVPFVVMRGASVPKACATTVFLSGANVALWRMCLSKCTCGVRRSIGSHPEEILTLTWEHRVKFAVTSI
jgi:hypothetical protein